MNSPRLKWLWKGPDYGYLTYPHYNGFFGDGRYMVIRKKVNIADTSPSLHIYDIENDTFTLFPNLPSGRTLIGGYWDVHYETGFFVSPETQNQAEIDGVNQRIWGIDLVKWMETGVADWQELWQTSPIGTFIPTIPDVACSIHPSGLKLAFSLSVPLQGTETYRRQLIELDLLTGQEKVCTEKEFNLNHVHYMPYDPNFIIFSKDESFASGNRERVWVYHKDLYPDAVNYMIQQYPQSSQITHLSHEKGGYNKESVYAVTYDGESNQRGIMRKSSLWNLPDRVSGGRDQHLDITRNGRWTVSSQDETSVTGVGSGFDIKITDNLLPNRIYANKDTLLLKDGVDLRYLGVQQGEAHPIFSPCGRYVFFQAAADYNNPTVAGGLRIGMIDTRNGEYDRVYGPLYRISSPS